MLLDFYKSLLARAISGAEENLANGMLSLSEALDLADRIETINCVIECLEEYYGVDETEDTTGMSEL